jgi:hypothetical protein
MTIGSISFWQQDQNFWAQGQKNDQTQSQSTALINLMADAVTTLSSGLASIANQTALNRVNTELSAAVQNALQGNTSSSSSSSSSASTGSSSSSASAASSNSSSSSNSSGSPAIGTGTVPLTTSTSLFTLGILKNGTVTVGDGTNTTTYKSTGSDTVANLINAINAGSTLGTAAVTAALAANGDLVLTGNNKTASITVGGNYAANIGFGAGHVNFQPIKPSSSSSNTGSSPNASSSSSSSKASTSSSSSRQSGSTGSSTGTSTKASSGIPNNSALALLTGDTAEILLASNGLSGNIVNLLA